MNDNQWENEQENENTNEQENTSESERNENIDGESAQNEDVKWEEISDDVYRMDPVSKKPKRNMDKKLVILIAVTAVYALAMGVLIGIVLSFLYSGGRSLEYKPVFVVEQSTEDMDENLSAADGIAKARESVVVIQTSKSVGTGVVLTEDGYILTNYHVIEGAKSILVRFLDGVSTAATVRGFSEDDDLAVLQIDRRGLIPAEFASTKNCFVGQDIYVIGTPIDADYSWTTTKGIISYLDREIKIYDDFNVLQKKMKLIQTDAMLNPGNSGGPMINSNGQVIGIVNIKLAGDADGIGFAIPSDGAIEIANAIMRDGNADSVNSSISFKRPVIGIVGVYVDAETYYIESELDGTFYITPATPSEIKENSEKLIYSKYSGFFINSVNEDSGAYGKLEHGDVIVEFDGEAVESREQLFHAIEEKHAGDKVKIKFYREGTLCSVDITLTSEKK